MELDRLPSTVMPPSAVNLTFDLLTGKPYQYVSWPRQLNWPNFLVKLAPIIMKILYSPSFWGHCLRWPWPLTFRSQSLTSTSMNPNTSVIKLQLFSIDICCFVTEMKIKYGVVPLSIFWTGLQCFASCPGDA